MMLHEGHLTSPTPKAPDLPELVPQSRAGSAFELSATLSRRSRLLKTQGMWRSAERLYCKFKHLTLHSRQNDDGTSCSCNKAGNPNRKRSLKVEYVKESQRSVWDSDSESDEMECYGQPPPCHGIPSFNLTSLCDGNLVARVPLDNFPAGDVIVRVYHNRICYRIHKHNPDFDDHHTITRAFHYGDTDIPVFVDAFSLSFQLNDNQLDISGKLKSVSSPSCLSLSTGDIPHATKLQKRRKSKHKSSPLCTRGSKLFGHSVFHRSNHKERHENHGFRERAYTR